MGDGQRRPLGIRFRNKSSTQPPEIKACPRRFWFSHFGKGKGSGR